MRATRLWTFSSLLLACGSELSAPESGSTSAREITAEHADAGAPATPPAAPPPLARKVDILVVVDDSGSMDAEQAALPPPLLELVERLRAAEVESVHVGLVSTNLGRPPGVQNPAGAYSCTDTNGVSMGGGANLHDSGALGARDVIAPGGQLLRTGDPACRDVELEAPYLAYGTEAGELDLDDPSARTQAELELSCVGTMGLEGCGIEQPLEAMWKALAPSSADDFVGPDTHGHGDGENAGFLRDDSLLVVLTVSDEDDCSVTPAGGLMFESGELEGYGVNVRCQMLQDTPAAEGALQPIARYVEGLLSLRGGDASRVIYGAIGGFPQGQALAPSSLLAQPAMTASLGSADRFTLSYVCGNDASGSGGASPGRRYVKLAQALAEAGAGVELQSVCDLDYADILSRVGDRVLDAVR